jgi:riboflavin synthase
MFTGIVEEIGRVRSIRTQGEAMVISILAKSILDDVKLGDSIAVNGVCLTVVQFDSSGFQADVMPETFRSTSLSELQPGSEVNLERAMAANGRFGGHIVQGHVDGTGQIVSKKINHNAIVFEIRPNRDHLMKYIIPKGSITIDGISLTVGEVRGETFTLWIIPHTLSQTVLKNRNANDIVNIECDVLGRYVEHFLQQSHRNPEQIEPNQKKGLSLERLLELGY